MTALRTLHVGIAQLPAWYGDAPGLLGLLDELLKVRRAELVVLPELGLSGYLRQDMGFALADSAEPVDGRIMTACSQMADAYQCALAVPLLEKDGDHLYNSLLLLDNKGQQIAHWRKRHPWLPESSVTPGNLDAAVVAYRGIRITAAICFDVHFLEKDAAKSLDEADLMLFPSAWVERPDSRPQLLRQLAMRHNLAIANANWGLGVPAVYGQGLSMIYGRNAQLVAHTARESEASWCDAVLQFE